MAGEIAAAARWGHELNGHTNTCGIVAIIHGLDNWFLCRNIHADCMANFAGATPKMNAQELMIEQIEARLRGFSSIEYITEVKREIRKCQWLLSLIQNPTYLAAIRVPPDLLE